MNRYFIRVAKAIVQYAVLFTVFFSFMNVIGYSKSSIADVVTSERGYLMLIVVGIFSFIYPFMSFAKKTLLFDAQKRVEDVERVMGMCGYKADSNEGGVMKFRASTTSKKVLLMWEDEITITTVDGISVMQGPRKEIVKIYFRFGTFVG